MAKLAVKDRKKAQKAEAVSGGFEPLPAGKYVATLEEVEAKDSQAGNPLWNITYSDLENMDGESAPGKQWFTLMMPQDEMPDGYKPGAAALKRADGDREQAWANYQEFVAGRIKAWFEAHGYDLSSDTEEMVGSKVILQIGIETIQSGNRAGEKTNRVNNVLPFDEDEHAAGGGDDGDDF